jgi:hypothetical protein
MDIIMTVGIVAKRTAIHRTGKRTITRGHGIAAMRSGTIRIIGIGIAIKAAV